MKPKKKKFSFLRVKLTRKKAGEVFNFIHGIISLVVVITIVSVGVNYFLPKLDAAGLDSIVATLLDGEAINTDSQVQVAFEVGGLSNGETITIYLAEKTTGDIWQDDGITTSHISCSDDGTGETYTADSVNVASGTSPMNAVFTATTVGTGATTVTCLIGDGGANNPNNPTVADGFSVTVITTDDAGAGIAYVGNANDVTVSVDMLSNLSLTIDNPDGTYCTISAGITTCDLGIVLTTNVAQGNYDVNVGTNASNGATVQINSDGAMRNGADELTDYVEDSGAITAGTDEYGIDLVADVAWTELGIFTDDASPVPETSTNVASTVGESDITGDDITVTHKVAIDSTVKAVTYTHVVTWTVTADF